MTGIYIQGEKFMVPDIGEKVSLPVYSKGHEFERIPYKGTVIYVHPNFRYYTVLFGEEPHTYRESYIIGW